MKVEITVPSSGESIKEGDIARWYKKSGEFVNMDEAILELETDKASLEITAEADGYLEILVEEGKTVNIGQVIGYLDTTIRKNAGVSKKIMEQAEVDDNDKRKKVPEFQQSFQEKLMTNVSLTEKSETTASPAARKLMIENNILPKEIKATGKGGRVTKQDVLNVLETRRDQDVTSTSKQKFVEFYNSGAPVISPDETVTLLRHPLKSDESNRNGVTSGKNLPEEEQQFMAAAPYSEKDRVEPDLSYIEQNSKEKQFYSRDTHREKITRLRKTLSQRLVEAKQTAALLTTFNEVDMSAIQSIRGKYKEQFKDTHDVGLGLMSFFTKAVCQALQQFPIVNAQIEKDHIVYFEYCDIGIAVAAPQGLVVPILRNAESMSFHEIERAISKMSHKAKNKELDLEDLTGGTFTITNGGVFGSLLSTPLINSPQSAILGMHNIVDRPVAENGEVVIKPMMYIALTYDHRLIDGADAVQFLRKVKTSCEDPIKLVLNL